MLKDGTAEGGGKGQSTKRELIKQRNYLMEENDQLLFQFKRAFMF
jgi:hypothetical protein